MMPRRMIRDVDELRGLTGQEAGVSEWIEISQAMIGRFAELTHDDQWIHVDVERARRESPFGGTIAHGFLTLSLMSAMVHQAVEVQGAYALRVNYGFNKLRFPSPVPAGSRVRGRVTVNAVRDIEGGAEVAWGIIVEVEGKDKPAIAAEWLTRMYRSR
jgi:acyl dehydratase